MAQSENLILRELSRADFAVVKPHLRDVKLRFEDRLVASGGAISDVIFPYSGVISLVVELSEGQIIETAMVGRDGVFGASSALNGDISLNTAIVQVGGAGSAIDIHRMREIADDSPRLRAALIKHDQVLLAQAQQAAACNASHALEARMCRWLLRIRDLSQANEFKLTQSFLAQMVGVQRSSVSIVASTLQRAGLIEYSRGTIRILDADALQQSSCECYGTIKSHYDHMFVAA